MVRTVGFAISAQELHDMRYDGYNGYIEVSAEAVTVVKSGLLGRLAAGRAEPLVVGLQSISGVEFEPATRLRNGHVRILQDGQARDSQATPASAAPNALLFTHKAQDTFAALRDWLEGVAKVNRPQAPSATPTRSASEPARTASPTPPTQRRTVLLRGRGWAGQSVVGESHYEANLRRLCGRRSGEHAVMATLMREPGNAYDRNAVQVLIDGALVGYLPKDDAPRYKPVLSLLETSGSVATCEARLWSQFDEDYFSASVSLDLDEPELLVPLNEPPSGEPVIVVPPRRSYQVSGEQEHLETLRNWIARAYSAGKALVTVTLVKEEVSTGKKPYDLVAIHLEGAKIGNLSKATSAKFLPLLSALAAHQVPVYAEAVITGNSLAVEATVRATPTEELPQELLDRIKKIAPLEVPSG